MLGYILTGGFLKGYRTYVLAAVGIVAAAASYSVGDTSLRDFLQVVWEIAGVGALAAIRAAKSE